MLKSNNKDNKNKKIINNICAYNQPFIMEIQSQVTKRTMILDKQINQK